jgi:hypothetical protein
MIKHRMAIIGGATALVLAAGGCAAYAASASIPDSAGSAMGACEDCRFIGDGLVILCPQHAPAS